MVAKMTRRKKKCEVDGCNILTNGSMCLAHSREKRRKFNNHYEMQRHHSLTKKYGISLDEFWSYWIIFKGKCSICQNDLKLPERRQGQSLDVVAVDHDHNTGQIRGLLCNRCNKGLGLFKDSPKLLESAANYLKK